MLAGIGILIYRYCKRRQREQDLINQQNMAYRNMYNNRRDIIIIQPQGAPTQEWQNYQQSVNRWPAHQSSEFYYEEPSHHKQNQVNPYGAS